MAQARHRDPSTCVIVHPECCQEVVELADEVGSTEFIIERLQEDDLVIKQARVRGKVGQPSVPISLNPDGAFSVGIKVGRRNMDALLVDFTGRVRQRHVLQIRYVHNSL